MIYIATPIDQNDRWRIPTELALLMREQELVGFVPARAFVGAVKNSMDGINTINIESFESCTGLLAFLPDGVPTLGVPVEIERAMIDGGPVAIVVGEHLYDHSVQVQDWSNRGAFVGRSLVEAVKWLGRMVKGEMPEFQDEVWTPEPITFKFYADPECTQEITPEPPKEVIRYTAGENGKTPTRQYAGDAGFDLYASEPVRIGPGEFQDVPVSVNAEFPEGVWGWIVGRSSTLRTKNLLVNQGIIDNGYRGELYVGVQNLATGGAAKRIERGERIAQLIPMPLLAANLRWELTTNLHPSDRGTNGFGSTG